MAEQKWPHNHSMPFSCCKICFLSVVFIHGLNYPPTQQWMPWSSAEITATLKIWANLLREGTTKTQKALLSTCNLPAAVADSSFIWGWAVHQLIAEYCIIHQLITYYLTCLKYAHTASINKNFTIPSLLNDWQFDHWGRALISFSFHSYLLASTHIF